MRRFRLVQAGEEPVDRADAPVGGDDETRPSLACRHRAVRPRDGLERADDGCARGDDATAPAVHGVDEPGGLLRDPKPLRIGALVTLLGGDAGMQHDRCDEDAAGNEPCDQVCRERPAGARHLGAAGLHCVDVLVGRERPRPWHVPVANRMPVLGKVERRRPVKVEACKPQPRARIRGEDLGRCTSGEDEALAGVDAAERLIAGAQLHDPEPVGIAAPRRGRKPKLELGSVCSHGRHSRRKRGRGVDDDEVTGGEKSRAAPRSGCGRWFRSARSVTRRRTRSRGRPRASGGSCASRTVGQQFRHAHAEAPTRSRAR